MAGKVRTKAFVLTATAVGFNMKMGKWVPNEDVYLIGFSSGACASAESELEYRVNKGVSDPTVDLEWDDIYFATANTIGAGGEGSGGSWCMLPPGYFYTVDEDEPVFIDLFAKAIGDGGSCVLYYVTKRDWKK